MKSNFLDLARKLSRKSSHPSHKLGAVVVKKNKILGIGFNQYKTNPNSPHPFKFIHAEFDAITSLNMNESPSGCTLYVYRQCKNGSLANSRPCNSCMAFIRDRGIRDVYYTHETGVKHEYI